MRVFTRTIAVAAAALTLAACSDDDRKSYEIPSAPGNLPADALSAFLTLSNTNAGPGDEVTVTVRALRGTAVGAIGSFTLKLDYDSTRLRFIESAPSSHGMVLTNATTAGTMIAAGASAAGFSDDQLVTAKFRVLGHRATQSLQLTVSELNSIAFQDQRAAMRVDRGLYRDRGNR